MTHQQDLALTLEALENFLCQARERKTPVLRQPPMQKLAEQLDLDRLIREGGLHGDTLKTFLSTYLDNATRIHHPACMGHQVSCPTPSGTIAGLIDSATNNPTAIYEMGAAGATIEYVIINWMLEKAGWVPAPLPGQPSRDGGCGGGVLTHGGSLAQLTALACARHQAAPDIWQNGNNPALRVIAPEAAHYSVARSLGILGIGQKALVPAPCDEQGRIIAEKLHDAIKAARRQGLVIMAVIANAGCTAAGLYDRLDLIAEVCDDLQVWLHVDGAHGASALLSDRHKHRLKGIERAASLIWDAHKMMRAPGLAAAVLVQNSAHLDHAFTQQASYLFHDKEQNGFDFISRTVECTKAALGLKVFTGLALEGEQGMASYIDSRYDLATRAAQMIREHPRFELAVEPESNIVCFRRKGCDDRRHLQMRKKLLATGESYLTTTQFMNKRWLRFTFMNPETNMSDVRAALNLVSGYGA